LVGYSPANKRLSDEMFVAVRFHVDHQAALATGQIDYLVEREQALQRIAKLLDTQSVDARLLAAKPDDIIVNQDKLVTGGDLHINLDSVNSELERFLYRFPAVPGIKITGSAVADNFQGIHRLRSARV